MRSVANKIASGSIGSSSRRRRSYILRDHQDANDRLTKDYFNDIPIFDGVTCKRRFRLSRRIFLRIAGDEREYTYFQQKPNAIEYLGLTTIQKCTLALRILSYGNTTDINDEYLKMAEKTTRD
ncbi:uncharacterized protein LOC143592094 [Bidens hawaiensis]|uniref:uncharacterized protein LOC143592094 n=1 Tax=Bidens hawaiensis TaxID=980011 RepID=UPI00404AB13E